MWTLLSVHLKPQWLYHTSYSRVFTDLCQHFCLFIWNIRDSTTPSIPESLLTSVNTSVCQFIWNLRDSTTPSIPESLLTSANTSVHLNIRDSTTLGIPESLLTCVNTSVHSVYLLWLHEQHVQDKLTHIYNKVVDNNCLIAKLEGQ